MDSRLRGNDDSSVGTVIAAEAGMKVRTAQPATPPVVIAAKAGIHAAFAEDGDAVAGTAPTFPARQRRRIPCPWQDFMATGPRGV